MFLYIPGRPPWSPGFMNSINFPYYILVSLFEESPKGKKKNYILFMSKNKNLDYIFKFKLKDGKSFEHKVEIDFETKTLINASETPKSLFQFTDLKHHQCENCPLKENEFSECPVARNMISPFDEFKDLSSFEEVELEVSFTERNYHKKVPIQKALETLLELVMISSPCPHFDFLKPTLVDYVPFLSSREFTIRCLKFYLLDHYLNFAQDGNPSFDILMDQFEELLKATEGLSKRVSHFENADTGKNAMVIFNALVMTFQFEYQDDFLHAREIFKFRADHKKIGTDSD